MTALSYRTRKPLRQKWGRWGTKKRAFCCPWLFLTHRDVFLSMSLVMELLLAIVPASVCGHPSCSQKRNTHITTLPTPLPTRCRVLGLDSNSRGTLKMGRMAAWCFGECMYPFEEKTQSSQGRSMPMCLVCLFSKPPHLSSCHASQASGDTPGVHGRIFR